MALQNCMEAIGLSEAQRREVMLILSALLELGNIDFPEDADLSEDDGQSGIHSDAVKRAAKMLRVTPEKLWHALTVKMLVVPGGNTMARPQTPQVASATRDTLSKAVYSSMFLWLVEVLNKTIKGATAPWGFIGVLDIYGFERFDINSLEQLLIRSLFGADELP